MADYEKEQSGQATNLDVNLTNWGTKPYTIQPYMVASDYQVLPQAPNADAGGMGANSFTGGGDAEVNTSVPNVPNYVPFQQTDFERRFGWNGSGNVGMLPSSPQVGFSSQAEALAMQADKFGMKNPYGASDGFGNSYQTPNVDYGAWAYPPKPVYQPYAQGSGDGLNQPPKIGGGGSGGSGGAGGGQNAWAGSPGAGVGMPPMTPMSPAAMGKLGRGNTDELELPDEVWRYIPENLRARFNESMQTWLRLRGFKGRGNFGSYAERSYQKPETVKGGVWFDPELFKSFADPQMGTWANWLLGELGYTNKIEQPLTDSTTPTTPATAAGGSLPPVPNTMPL